MHESKKVLRTAKVGVRIRIVASEERRVDVGLCLSGGGYRAAVFHLGSLLRLNEAGMLARLRTVSSVSGGSIVAAWLGYRWPHLRFEDGVCHNLTEEIVDPLLAFTREGVDAAAVIRGAFIPGVIDRQVQKAYRRLFGDATLADLPGRGEGPEVILTATNLSTGALFRFGRFGVGDFRRDPDDTSAGFFQAPTVPLVTAVAASSAFPPILSPCIFPAAQFAESRAAQRTVYLTDGGIYDNLGVEPLDDKAHKIVLSSDGGAPFRTKPKPPRWYLAGTVHVLKVVDLQVRKLRRQELIASANPGRLVGYWGINIPLIRYQQADRTAGAAPFAVLPVSDSRRAALAGIPTRLAPLSREQQHQLVNWGYALADATIRRYIIDGARGSFPYPGGVG
ncbi:patatin-like phospholipase family protein [Microbacterium sp. P5_E9]